MFEAFNFCDKVLADLTLAKDEVDKVRLQLHSSSRNVLTDTPLGDTNEMAR